jgi:aerobic carbon-monoxide dehydrogenase small subunit
VSDPAERIEVVLQVNSETQAVHLFCEETLLSALRDRLGLTGAKRGCNQGVCGACSVLIDGMAMRSCLALAANCEGREIVTVEGVAPNGVPSVVQRAFVESGAVQCGFCTPGFVMALTGLLRHNPAPREAEIREALGGNICRCTGYAKIVEAARRAVEAVPR